MRKSIPFAILLLGAACQATPPASQPAVPITKGRAPVDDDLFFVLPMADGTWTYVDFGSNGGVELEKDTLVIHQGERLEGVKYAGKPEDILGASLDRYEIKLEVQRTGGHDILLGLTFPVGAKESSSLVLGGWGGSVCGISSVDDKDASGNEWKSIRNFEDGKWYAVTLRVDASQVRATLDGKELFSVPRAGHAFGLRAEVEPTAPFGFFTFGTSAKIRNIAVRELK